MKTKDLIALLQQCDPEGTVTVWDAYNDCEDFDVHVSVGRHDKYVHVGNNVFGDEVNASPPQAA
jgi:hypothetical protein